MYKMPKICQHTNCSKPASHGAYCGYHAALEAQQHPEKPAPPVTRRVLARFNPAAFMHPGRKLIQLMRDVEAKQDEVKEKRQAVHQHLADNPTLKPLWDDFQERGGSTSQELAAWLSDDDWVRKDELLRCQHLRLVHSREPAIVVQRTRVKVNNNAPPRRRAKIGK